MMVNYSSTMKSLILCIIMMSFSLNFNNFVLGEKFMFKGYMLQPSRRLIFSPPTSVVNVLDYGAVGDGSTDDSKAFEKAWEKVCNSNNKGAVLQVPAGKNFLLNPMKFEGPCKSSPIHVQIEGTLEAPKTMEGWGDLQDVHSWIEFSEIQDLHIDGHGQLDGHGSLWWSESTVSKKFHAPTALQFHACDGLRLHGLTHLNSPRNHISINKCQHVELSKLRMIAPEDSPNTDGIDISASTDVHIHHTRIETGDDCIAINDGSSLIHINNVKCGPGHGISVGSLGKDGNYETVEGVYVKNCTFNGGRNGARIKTWEGGSGYARNITFENIIFNNTRNPIIIDQHYIDHHHKIQNINLNKKQAVGIRDVRYINMKGSSADEKAISLLCSDEVPCENISFDNVHIEASDPKDVAKGYVENAQVKVLSDTSPKIKS